MMNFGGAFAAANPTSGSLSPGGFQLFLTSEYTQFQIATGPMTLQSAVVTAQYIGSGPAPSVTLTMLRNGSITALAPIIVDPPDEGEFASASVSPTLPVTLSLYDRVSVIGSVPFEPEPESAILVTIVLTFT
jgi:hypothetical protein